MTAVQKKRVAKLVAALRSGKYKQARHRLRDGDRFCCLGVACDVHRVTTKLGMWDGGTYRPDGSSWGRTLDLPMAVAEWFGFSGTVPELLADDDGAAHYNDSLEPRHGFKAIATQFEKTYLTTATRRK